MPSRADVEQFAQANRNIRALALAALRAFWGNLDHNDATGVRDALSDYLPLLVAQYGEIAATVAADFFDSMREQAAARGAFSAVLADTVSAEKVMAEARWAIGPLFSAEPQAADALGRLEIVVDKATLQPGRDTIAASAAHDPAKARWARVPVGKTCAFCTVLASRGAVYTSAESAGEGRKYHGKCDCTPTPIWGNQPYPEGYDPDALYEQYNAARQAAGSGRLKPILAELRSQGLAH